MIPNWIKNISHRFWKANLFSRPTEEFITSKEAQVAPVVMIHGNPTWSFLWRKVIAELEQDAFSFYAPDLLNLGFSEALQNKDFDMQHHGDALTGWAKSLDLKDAILVVQDWGGPLGLYMASQLKETFKGLVILNTGVAAPKEPFKVSKFHSFVNRKWLPEIMFQIFRFPMFTLHKIQGDPESLKGQTAKAYRYPLKKYGRWSSALQFARMVPNGPDHPSNPLFHDVEKYCQNFSGPVEIVWGTKDPILGRGLKSVTTVIPQANVTTTDAGHFLQEECPKEIASAIRRAAEKLP